MDIRHRALGLRQQIKYISNTAMPVKTPPCYNKCALVLTNQTIHSDLRIPYVHSVLQDYIHKHRSALEVHSNPPRGTFTPHNTHQETEKTLDIRCDKLRCGQWTNTWSNDTTNRALAYRELCTVFSDC